MKAITTNILIGMSILILTQASAIAESIPVGEGQFIPLNDITITDSGGTLTFSLGRRTLSTSEGDINITEDMASFDEAQITLVSPTGERYMVSRAITQVDSSGNLLPSSSVTLLGKKAYRMPSKNEQILLVDPLGDGADMPCQRVKWRHDPATGEAHARCSAADRDAFKSETQNAIPYTAEYMSIDPGGILGIDPGGILGIDPGGILGIDPGGILGIDPGGILGIDPGGILGIDPGGILGIDPGGILGVDTNESGWTLEVTDTNPLVENATASEVDTNGDASGDNLQIFFNRFEILDWNMELNP
jgi:hypothetical protein